VTRQRRIARRPHKIRRVGEVTEKKMNKGRKGLRAKLIKDREEHKRKKGHSRLTGRKGANGGGVKRR